MWKVKNDITFEDLKELGFIEETFGLYGSGDYIPEHWYSKRYEHRDKTYYLDTNHRYMFGDTDTVTHFIIKTPHKSHKYYKYIPFNRVYKIVRIILKDLLKMGLVEEVRE